MRGWRLAWLRLRRGTTGLAGAVALLAVVQSLLVLLFAAQPRMEADAVRERVAALPAGDAWLAVVSSDPTITARDVAAPALAGLRGLSSHAVEASLTYRPLSDRRFGRYQLVAVDAPSRVVQLQSGRLPTPCRATPCEVVRVGAADSRVPDGLRVVGQARLRADAYVASLVEPGCTLYIAAGVSARPLLALAGATPRTLAWATPVDASRIAQHGLTRYLADMTTTSDALSLRPGGLSLVGPNTQLDDTAGQVQALRQRMLALLCCLLVIVLFSAHRVAVAARRRQEAADLVTRQFGWSSRTRRLHAVTVVAGATFGAAAIGLGAGAFLTLVVMRWPLVTDGLAAWSLGMVAAAGLAIAGGLVAAPLPRAASVAVACVAWLLVAALERLDVGVLLLAAATGAVVAFLPAVVARIPMAPFRRNLLRGALSQWTALAVVTGFLAAYVLGASASLDTLRQGVRDHAVFQSPLATRITWGERSPLQDNSLAAYRTITDGSVYAVRTVPVTLRRSMVEVMPAQLLVVDPKVWAQVPDISRQTGLPNATLGNATRSAMQALGVSVHGGELLQAQVSGLDARVSLWVWVLDADGEAREVALPVSPSGDLSLRLPADARSIIGLALRERADAGAHRAHAVGEGSNALAAPAGTLTLRGLRIGGDLVDLPTLLPAQATATAPAVGSLRWAYALVGGEQRLTLVPTPSDIPVVVDPATAALVQDGRITVRLTDDAVLGMRVRAVAQRLPTVAQHFILAAPGALEPALAAVAPEYLRVSEVWSTGLPTTAAQQAGRLNGLTVWEQQQLVAMRAAASATTWTSRTLDVLVAVVLAMLLAFVGWSARSIAGAADLAGWRAQGLPLQAMRRVIVGNVVALAAGAVLVALALVTLLFPLTLRLSDTDITGATAVPPLAPTGMGAWQWWAAWGMVGLAWLTARVVLHRRGGAAWAS